MGIVIKNIFTLRNIEKIISGIVALAGILLAIAALQDDVAKWTILVIIISDTLLLILFGVYCAIYSVKNSETNKYIKLSEVSYNKMITNNKYINTTLGKFLSKLYTISGTYINDIDKLHTYVDNMKVYNHTQEDVDNYEMQTKIDADDKACKSLIDDYNSFLLNITAKLRESIEAYLRTKGNDFKVSVSVKQLNAPIIIKENTSPNVGDVIIYTSFRDSITFTEGIRKEIGKKKYSINKNSDFLHCLENDTFVFNNKRKSSKDYMNENAEFEEYYNCGVTSIINSSYDECKKTFGFITCDTLNIYESKEIFDDNVASIVYSYASIIATYFDNFDYIWKYFELIDNYNDFWSMMFNKCNFDTNSKKD